MARRAGKAANRKARQRSAAQRAATRPSAPPPAPPATPVAPVGTPDAVSLEPPRKVAAPSLARAGSTLTTSERAEYHYVERDLRNIGILTAAMAVLLFLAWILFNATGLVG